MSDNQTKTAVKNALRELLGEQDEQQDDSDFGFVTGNSVTYIFANREHFDHGHMVDRESDQAVQLPSSRIRGYLTNVRYFQPSRGEYNPEKLRIDMQMPSGEVYMIETGFFTNTSKSALSALAEIDASQPVTLQMDPSDDDERSNDNVLFINAYQNDNTVDSDWPSNDQELIDFYKIVREQVLGLEPQQEQPSPRQGHQQQTQTQTQTQQAPQTPGQQPPAQQPAGPPGGGNQPPSSGPPNGTAPPSPGN